MRKIINILLALVFTSFTMAQAQSGRVQGRVEDASRKVIESATISLLKAEDSSVYKINVADRSGAFVFEQVPSGSFLVSVTAVGHQMAYSEKFEITPTNRNIILNPTQLAAAAKSMAAVTVTAKKPLIENRIDRTVVNVDASPSNVGSSALEVLEKSPGITVDKDGNISLKGKQGVMVLVDGRPTQLGGADLANMLRAMTASQLDQIEIMTNPPARYDAAGNAGIINIKTKKNRQFGYNGTASVTYGQGRYPKINESINFNYRAGKVNLFTNLSHNYRKNFNNLDIQRNLRERSSKELAYYFDQEARMQNNFHGYNGKVGADYFASKNTTFGVVFSGIANPGTFTNRNQTFIYDKDMVLESEARARAIQKQNWKHFSTNLNFRQLLDTAGKELTADVDYLTYATRMDQTLSNYYFDAAGKQSQKADTLFGSLPQDIRIYSGKVDYLHPLKKGARFEAGVKASMVATDNNAVYDTVHHGAVIHDYSKSNHFIYEENINAAYVNLSGNLSKKVSAQLGLRLESTNAKGKQMTTGESFDRHYTQLFPTAFLQYKANDKNNFGLNYGRRIRRPNYESLNPFIEFLDRYTYEQGNPNLKPQFSHNIELSHSYRNFLTTTFNFTRTTDIIQTVIEQNTERKETYVKQANIASQQQYGISLSANHPVTKWWTSNLYINASNNRFEGIVDSSFVTIDASMLMLNGTQQFKLGKSLSAELSGFFRTGGIEGVIRTRPMGMFSVALSKQVMKTKGTVRLNVRDVLHSQRFRAQTRYGNVDASFQEWRDTRVVNLGFTYRFSKGKLNGSQRRRNGSANDEQSRVGGGSQ